MDKIQTMSERIKALLDEIGISKKTLSLDMGFKENFLYEVCSGKNSNPSESMFSYLQKHFGANVDWLKTGAGSMFLADTNDKRGELLRKLDTLLPSDQDAVLDIVDALANLHRVESDKHKQK